MNRVVSSKIVVLTFGVLVIAFLAAFYAFSWQEPSQAPPQGNVPSPINVGNQPQAKAGRISATEFYDYNNPSFYINPSGNSRLAGSLSFGSMSRPTSPETGQVYFDQTDKTFYYWNGTMWRRMENVPSGTGKVCSVSTECESGFCVDGYCCDSACNTNCYSCNVPGREGYCTQLTNYTEDTNCKNTCTGCYQGSCVNIAAGVKDEAGLSTCTATHYRCDGVGNCTAPKSTTGCLVCNDSEVGKSFSTICINRGYTGCDKAWAWPKRCEYDQVGCGSTCAKGWAGDPNYGDWAWSSFLCFNWVYD